MADYIEKVERVLDSDGGLEFKVTCLLGKKTSGGNRLDAMFSKSYDSTKYNGVGKLTTLKFSPSIYLVFSVFNTEKKTSEEVYSSYSNLNDLEEFFSECIETLTNNNVYNEDDINTEFKELEFISPSLASGKQIKIIPYKIPVDDNTFVNGVVFMCNDEDHYALVSLTKLEDIYEKIKSYRICPILLSNESNSLYEMALLYTLTNNMSTNSNISSYNSKPTFESKSNFGNKSNFGSKTTSTGIGEKREFKRRSVTRKPSEDSNSNPTVDEILDEEPKKITKSSKGISMNDIMTKAESITDLDIDDDVDF